jgi:hypothetical protein
MKKAAELLLYIVAVIVALVTCFIWFVVSILAEKPEE